ncbi:hypothetical protein G7Y89_g13499 [Cudoniella acicularis]|uniref:RNA-directed RNA polymerase n=1 Tax=Cudoniella acicularis TaxID=354080 RepID=A0A8H4R9I2_9HELO|nr:hypothetical protein G7Y89_g13499 [Cudoniella acicularis]
MEVFVRDVPIQVTANGLRNLLSSFMTDLSIQIFHCEKQKNGKFAWLTFLRVEDGQRFLAKYGQGAKKIAILGVSISCALSKNAPNQHMLGSLALEEKNLRSKEAELPIRNNTQHPETAAKKFSSSSVSCGVWTYANSTVVFAPTLTWKNDGVVKFGTRSLSLTLDSGNRMDIPYSVVLGITLEESPQPLFTFTLCEAPRFYETHPSSDSLAAASNQSRLQRKRTSFLSGEHEWIFGSCLVYRIVLKNGPKVGNYMRALIHAPGMPPMIHQRINVGQFRKPLIGELKRLQDLLIKMSSSPVKLPWKLCFQVRRLAMNAYLTPEAVLDLLPEIENMMSRSGLIHTTNAIRKMFHQIPFAGPDTEAQELELSALIKLLKSNEEQSKRGEFGEDETDSRRTDSINFAMVHRAMLTPAGIYLYGPDPEPMNRVLRKYSTRHEYFLRMEFADEDGQPVRFNPRVSNDAIFNERFKQFLDIGFSIAGRKYDFLGFSHSSLRSQACWFMAPFAHNGSLLYDRMLIRELGDFSKIRCPAKCAARIGQAFSETPTVITLGPGIVGSMNDIERNGRVFSDGVGTISKSVMKKIWEALPKTRRLKPTCFQIRFQGAKGMLSLDSRLEGDHMFLRPSMIKFEGSNSMDIELCGANYKPLPMYLNRQLIKILEDMGVEHEWFLKLQETEVERLRETTESPSNASDFLRSHSVGESVHLPWLIKKLHSFGLDFREDRFLWDVLQMSVMMELRVLKHRTRIPVKNGHTLYGILDETGILEEGQAFCIFDNDKGKRSVVVGKNLIITRSPALHPGDIQLVECVSVPKDSPLHSLSNCICFSQKGKRDLPSQLSGGDLDGDLYNIIWDRGAKVKEFFEPADYPRQDPEDIQRPVERKDMTDFFVKFMETDQLGRIATSHQILADQSPFGTRDPNCRLLAEMHSTAVDFSKTGVPVNMSKMPKIIPARPDFMAPGPYVKLETKEGLILEESKATAQNTDDDDDFKPYRYYESKKILGKLYRAIDEHEIFTKIKSQRLLQRGSTSTVLNHVWAHVQTECQIYDWRSHIQWAWDIRDMYEDCILSIMTTYSEHPLRPISETEAFIGNILGATGVQSKKQRDLSVTMKERFDRDAIFIIECINGGSSDQTGDVNSREALERSIACLQVSLEPRKAGGSIKKVGDIDTGERIVKAAHWLDQLRPTKADEIKNKAWRLHVPISGSHTNFRRAWDELSFFWTVGESSKFVVPGGAADSTAFDELCSIAMRWTLLAAEGQLDIIEDDLQLTESNIGAKTLGERLKAYLDDYKNKAGFETWNGGHMNGAKLRAIKVWEDYLQKEGRLCVLHGPPKGESQFPSAVFGRICEPEIDLSITADLKSPKDIAEASDYADPLLHWKEGLVKKAAFDKALLETYQWDIEWAETQMYRLIGRTSAFFIQGQKVNYFLIKELQQAAEDCVVLAARGSMSSFELEDSRTKVNSLQKLPAHLLQQYMVDYKIQKIEMSKYGLRKQVIWYRNVLVAFSISVSGPEQQLL